MTEYTLRRLNARPGCSTALLPFALGRRLQARPGASASVAGFFAFLRYGLRGAPPWAPAAEPREDNRYAPGIPCRGCGTSHSEVICNGCGHGRDLVLMCDRCVEEQPFDLIGTVQLRGARIARYLGTGAALGVAASLLLGRKAK